jgi:hypothetical protein
MIQLILALLPPTGNAVDVKATAIFRVADGRAVGILVWAAEHPLGLLGPMIEAVAPFIPEPFPRAYDPRSAAMTADEVEAVLHSPY